MRISVFITALLLTVYLSRAEAAPQPNIVFIIADDLGWADVAFHGGPAPTPHLDQMRAAGVELTQHYVWPVCSPTRASLLSGRHASRFGVTNPQNKRAFPWDTVTLPGALKSVGYDTCLTGKWHLGSLPEWGPEKFGFDHSYGSLAGGVGPWDHRYKTGEYSITWQRAGKLLEETGHVTDLITSEAVDWIGNRTEKPFFLYIPFTAVHLPLKEPDQWLQKVPASVQGEVARHYAASIMHLDDAVGRIHAALDQKGLRERTVVVFTSDNGGSTSQNRDLKYPADAYPLGNLPGSNLPLRGQKGDVYEGGIRVPTIIQWPGTLKPGKLTSPVQVCDWMPTFCALAGYLPDGERKLNWDGQDLWPCVSGADSSPATRTLYWAGPGFRTQAIREGDLKLVVTRAAKGQAATVELFDLAQDPNESHDLAAARPEMARALQHRLAEVSKADRDAEVMANDSHSKAPD